MELTLKRRKIIKEWYLNVLLFYISTVWYPYLLLIFNVSGLYMYFNVPVFEMFMRQIPNFISVSVITTLFHKNTILL